MMAPPTPARPPLRILVVDDCVEMAESWAGLLRLWGHEVRLAHDGPEALRLVRAAAPEVVLLDVGLPGMDGFELARRLRRDVGLHEARLMAVTGYADDDDRRRAREAGCDRFAAKPVDLAELRAWLDTCRTAGPRDGGEGGDRGTRSGRGGAGAGKESSSHAAVLVALGN